MNLLKSSLCLVIAGCLFLSGCSQPQAPTTSSSSPLGDAPIAVTVQATQNVPSKAMQVVLPGGQDVSFDPSKGFYDPRPDIKEGTISVANYEFQMKPMAANSVDALSQDGQTRIAFGLNRLPAGSFDKNIIPGDYAASDISFVEAYTFENGAQKQVSFENHQGTVTVTEVTDAQISGSIDVTGDKGAVMKGTFTAHTTKKS